MMTRWLVPTLGVAALGVAACSSGDETSSTTAAATVTSVTTAPAAPATTAPPPTTAAPTSPPTTAAPTTAPPTAPPTTLSLEEADQALARTALLTLDSFPSGWVAAPPEPDEELDETAAFEAEFDACLTTTGERVIEPFENLEVNSDTFSTDGPTQPDVEHGVVLVPDETTALAAMAEVATEGASACIEPVLETFFQESLLTDPDTPEGLTIGDVTVERADDGTSPDRTVGYIIAVPFQIGDEAATQYLHVWYQREGRALSNLQMSSFAEPFDALGIETLTDVVQENLAAIAG